MRTLHYILAVALVAMLLLNSVPAVTACGKQDGDHRTDLCLQKIS